MKSFNHHYIFSMIIICYFVICSTSFALPHLCNEGGVKIQKPRIYPNGWTESRVLTSRTGKRYDKNTVKNTVMPQQVRPSNIYQHQIDGEWDYVVGQIGFFHEFEDLGKSFVSIIGIGTYDEGNGIYSTEDWNREAFWFEVGDGEKLHLAAEFYGEFDGIEDEPESVYVYYCYNLLYREKGRDYSSYQFNGEWIDFKLITDTNYQYIDHNILIYDGNDELIEERKFEPGDQVQSYTSVFDLDDPETVWVTTMDETFHTIQSEPVFTYEHLTPNVDFPNDLTNGVIDFSNIELQLVLLGVNEENENSLFNYSNDPFQYSSAIDIGIKWNGATSTSVFDWVYHFFRLIDI